LESDEDDAAQAEANKQSDRLTTRPRDCLATPLEDEEERYYGAEENDCANRVKMLQLLYDWEGEILPIRLWRYNNKKKNSNENSGSYRHITVQLSQTTIVEGAG
jgi:hypothetical protein